MKLALQMTLDGMVRAMRMKVHDIREDPEQALRRAEQRNETTLALLSEESRRVALEAGDEFRR